MTMKKKEVLLKGDLHETTRKFLLADIWNFIFIIIFYLNKKLLLLFFLYRTPNFFFRFCSRVWFFMFFLRKSFFVFFCVFFSVRKS